MALYVRMTDSSMSGWGGAQGKKNVYVVECETEEQANHIISAAEKRSEMKYVQLCLNFPRPRPNVVYTHRLFSQLGDTWQKG